MLEGIFTFSLFHLFTLIGRNDTFSFAIYPDNSEFASAYDAMAFRSGIRMSFPS